VGRARAEITINTMSGGTVNTTSANPTRTLSSFPPTMPDTAPSVVAISVVRNAVMIATLMISLPPWTIWFNTSRPALSVPRKCWADGVS